MAAAAEPPPESVPPQKRASGAEIAPLVDGADAEPEEDPAARAEREVAEAEELQRQWEAGERDGAPFDLTVQPSIGGEEAAITLEGVTSEMTTAELHKRVETEMESHPHPDVQRLFIMDGGKGPLRDETLPIGAYGVVAGVTLHLAMRNGKAAAERREARAELRVAQAKAAREAREAEARAAQWEEAEAHATRERAMPRESRAPSESFDDERPRRLIEPAQTADRATTTMRLSYCARACGSMSETPVVVVVVRPVPALRRTARPRECRASPRRRRPRGASAAIARTRPPRARSRPRLPSPSPRAIATPSSSTPRRGGTMTR